MLGATALTRRVERAAPPSAQAECVRARGSVVMVIFIATHPEAYRTWN